MTQGLKPHRHVWVVDRVNKYHDSKKHCGIKKITYYCPVCALYGVYKTYHERYEYEPPPTKSKTRVLEKHKKRYGSQW